ncbi:MAG: hypothetical protein Q8P36_01805, partial [bacterium]|nr:hypothetical protein [bacterium]
LIRNHHGKETQGREEDRKARTEEARGEEAPSLGFSTERAPSPRGRVRRTVYIAKAYFMGYSAR